MKKAAAAFLVCFAAGHAGAAEFVSGPVDADNPQDVVTTFVEACGGFPGGGAAAVTAWAAEKKLEGVGDQILLNVFVGDGAKNGAWLLPAVSSRPYLAVSVMQKPAACAVWSQHVDPDDMAQQFNAFAADFSKDAKFEVVRDTSLPDDGHRGHLSFVVYQLMPPGKPDGFDLVLITADNDDGPYQASIELSASQRRKMK